jgi:hypothetical protein
MVLNPLQTYFNHEYIRVLIFVELYTLIYSSFGVTTTDSTSHGTEICHIVQMESAFTTSG